MLIVQTCVCCHTTYYLLQKVIQQFEMFTSQASKGGPSPLNALTIVLLGIWTLANTETFRQIADRFDVAKSTAHDVSGDLCRVLNHCLPMYVQWPTVAEMGDIAEAFENRTGFPGAVGAIDGCHVPIKKPMENTEGYYNRKKFFSINLLAIVDHRMAFRHVHVGWPGSVHDARVYRNSPVYDILTDNSLPQHLHVIGDCISTIYLTACTISR